MAEKKPGNNASGSDMTSATWSYILPSLDYIMRDPIPTQDNRAPTLTVAQHANIYTVVYNFATASRMGLAGVPGFGLTGATGMREGFDAEREASMDKFERVRAMIGYELYSLLDDYFRDLAREIRMNAPLPPPTPSPTLTSNPRGRSSTQSKAKARAATSSDPSEPLGDELALLRYYMNAYTRFSSGAAQINRLFAYLNRHFVMRAIDEGCGWISLSDVIAASVLKDLASMSISASHKPPKREKPVTNGASASSKKTKEDLKKLEAKKHAEWRKWGYDASQTPSSDAERKVAEQRRRIAELCAEAASGIDRIVTCSALAMRRWRLEIAEPLLDPQYWNSNGNHDAWTGSSSIPPTSLSIPDKKGSQGLLTKHVKFDQHRTGGTMIQRSLNVPLVLPSSGPKDRASEAPNSKDQGKGKGRGSRQPAYDLALSIPVQVTTSNQAAQGVDYRNRSGSSSPQSGDASTHTSSGTTTVATTSISEEGPKKKRPAPRKGASSTTTVQTSLAAVRAATAAATAARVAEESGVANLHAHDLVVTQKSRLSRALAYLLDCSPTGGDTPNAERPEILSRAEQTLLEPTAKLHCASVIAESLMMCGMTPDNAIRRRLDRFLTKAEQDGRVVEKITRW